MVIRNRNGNDIRPSEITPRGIYLNRRELMGKAAGLGASAGLAGSAALSLASLPFRKRKPRRSLSRRANSRRANR